jgi:PAS domain S-box-containing protein
MATVALDWFLRSVLDGAPDGILTECGDRIAYINDAYARILGYRSARELAGATIHDIAHPQDEPMLQNLGRQRRDGLDAPSRYSFRVRRRDCSFAVLDASVSATRLGKDCFITTIVREIAEVSRVPFAQPEDVERLTTREREVLRHTLLGERPKEIALQM